MPLAIPRSARGSVWAYVPAGAGAPVVPLLASHAPRRAGRFRRATLGSWTVPLAAELDKLPAGFQAPDDRLQRRRMHTRRDRQLVALASSRNSGADGREALVRADDAHRDRSQLA